MNILPKKRWHVRTKENIARVRRDEAAAQEEEQKRESKLKLAESEARINFLRKQSGLPEKLNVAEKASNDEAGVDSSEHFDLFSDYKSHIKTTNKDLEREKKEVQEKYEKQIGYLTYLGQDTNEALKSRSWYELPPRRVSGSTNEFDLEKDQQKKQALDPLTLINSILPKDETVAKPTGQTKDHRSSTEVFITNFTINQSIEKQKSHKKHKRKKHKKHGNARQNAEDDAAKSEHKRVMLQRLREERLKRESKEKLRQEALFAPTFPTISSKKVEEAPKIIQKYSSQFNPDLARQNFA